MQLQKLLLYIENSSFISKIFAYNYVSVAPWSWTDYRDSYEQNPYIFSITLPYTWTEKCPVNDVWVCSFGKPDLNHSVVTFETTPDKSMVDVMIITKVGAKSDALNKHTRCSWQRLSLKIYK